MMKDLNKFSKKLDKATSISEVFQLVNDVVHETFSVKHNGLTVCLDKIPMHQNGIVAGLYVPENKTIVVNNLLLKEIKSRNPELLNGYLFHVLLHEYLHSIGFVDEQETRKLAFLISNRHFGMDHVITKIALNINKFIGQFGINKIPFNNPVAIEEPQIIDRWTINYIG